MCCRHRDSDVELAKHRDVRESGTRDRHQHRHQNDGMQLQQEKGGRFIVSLLHGNMPVCCVVVSVVCRRDRWRIRQRRQSRTLRWSMVNGVVNSGYRNPWTVDRGVFETETRSKSNDGGVLCRVQVTARATRLAMAFWMRQRGIGREKSRVGGGLFWLRLGTKLSGGPVLIEACKDGERVERVLSAGSSRGGYDALRVRRREAMGTPLLLPTCRAKNRGLLLRHQLLCKESRHAGSALDPTWRNDGRVLLFLSVKAIVWLSGHLHQPVLFSHTCTIRQLC